MKQKAVFLDRDGVINPLLLREDGEWTSPHHPSEFEFLPGIVEVAQNLRNEGYLLFCVTNQPGVYMGRMEKSHLNEMMETVSVTLGLTDYLCALNKNNLDYKPGNQMIETLVNKYSVDRKNSFMVGDRWKDIEAGHRSGLKTIFVGETYTKPNEYVADPDYTAADSYEFCSIIINGSL